MMAVVLVTLILGAWLGIWALFSGAARTPPDWQASFEVDLDDEDEL